MRSRPVVGSCEAAACCQLDASYFPKGTLLRNPLLDVVHLGAHRPSCGHDSVPPSVSSATAQPRQEMRLGSLNTRWDEMCLPGPPRLQDSRLSAVVSCKGIPEKWPSRWMPLYLRISSGRRLQMAFYSQPARVFIFIFNFILPWRPLCHTLFRTV